ncbi:LysR family transcriptional regulator [Microbulbifer sp. ZKSA004]|uniref:helix-turn-helix domain-containing protein n=1 Tax=Microbulbifer sp. ZKSA004 TaxID=3243389 RepID=UPI00403A7286
MFAKVVESGSFRGASSELDISIASVSSYVARLEESLGVALLYRNTRKLSLTKMGKRFIKRHRIYWICMPMVSENTKRERNAVSVGLKLQSPPF